ncbi:hypothetical protein Skr01_70430 [Sphaerisporangium krabiense]|uniref:Winged helix DNA-binding domain-containing protein n=1 Tax=Sphaerisporangium krabiense TaxID=763782 RepID=A0A7W8Z037_9ACTN|nr:winged helix DNA-binding domain-containing protein [Sphaerisporangium krabiense]MBB5625002.1 hypothetical protein [Sphaerisporangium krabiense]GII66958.1 hypothetical protein Skr01_70430 [Sphaerisporangium krabiense]
MKLTWDAVLAWRMRRQFLDRPQSTSTEQVVRRLCGVQSQVRSYAELAVAVRSPTPVKDAVQRGIAAKELMRTWAMRGTLHALSTRDAPAFLSLLASARTWEKGAWQRSFLDAPRMARLADAVRAELDGAVLTREELVAAVERRTKDATIGEAVRSGWGTVLKPLAWLGDLCNGDGEDGRVTFTNPATHLPGWPGLPEPDAAARVAIPAYLSAYGPAGPDAFNRWLVRGALKKTTVRRWFADLGDVLTEVDVEGERLWVRTEDADSLASAAPTDMLRLLPAFDQYVLGVGTDDTRVIPSAHRREVSRTSGWISPVLVHAGKVTGVWENDEGALSVTLFPDAPKPDTTALETEATHLGALLSGGKPISIAIS